MKAWLIRLRIQSDKDDAQEAFEDLVANGVAPELIISYSVERPRYMPDHTYPTENEQPA